MLFNKYLFVCILSFFLVACSPTSSGSKKNSSAEKGDQLYDVSISWEPVTENIKGNIISNINSYRVEWQKEDSEEVFYKEVEGATTSSTDIIGVTSGSYLFTVYSVLVSGVKSEASQVWNISVGN